MKRGAYISLCGKYRYYLTRDWLDDLLPNATPDELAQCVTSVLMVIGLNPSSADGEDDDPTMRRVIKFARGWGFTGLIMTNLFAFRSSEPEDMIVADDPIGPLNDLILTQTMRECSQILCVWGAHGHRFDRDQAVLAMTGDRPVFCMGLNQDGSPRHPLYLKADTPMQVWEKPVCN